MEIKNSKPLDSPYTTFDYSSNICTHYLRHTFCSHGINQTGNIHVLREILGHSSAKQTERYSHMNDASRRQLTDSVNDVYTEAIASITVSSMAHDKKQHQHLVDVEKSEVCHER